MTIDSPANLVQALRDGRLLEAGQLKDLPALQQRCRDVRTLAKELVQRGWLTAYQVQRLLQGQAGELSMGPYLVLDLLGEGGWGRVFKARHRGQNRLVALKVIRPDMTNDAEVVGRFHREMKIASQLAHPNMVRVSDSGPLGSTHFLAMEYIDGIDLDRLVKKSGRLPVAQAREYIRQAACGLAHAHEKGLVHRDIKPSNLLVTQQAQGLQPLGFGAIKILDLGLARLLQGSTSGDLQTTNPLTLLTSDGPVTLGTVDYLAPEQALDFHKADIRADIYSLGCTFVFLLTGKPPFGEAPLAVKLMRHQHAEPPDLHALHPEVPADVARIIRRMLAKRPKDRYQTPAEVADALGAVLNGRAAPLSAGRWRSVAGMLRRLGQTAWHRPRLVLLGLGALLLLAGLWLAGAALVQRGGSAPQSAELTGLLARLDQSGTDYQALRQEVLAFRIKHAGTPDAFRATELLMQLPSPADRLDPKAIPAELRLPDDPRELVAVLGQPGQQRVHGVAFSPDGKLLATGGEDRLIRLWEVATGQVRATLDGHERAVNLVEFAPDGKTLASAGGDLRLWDVTYGKEKLVRKYPSGEGGALAFSPDGQTVVVGGGHVARLWDTASEKERLIIKDIGHLVFAMSFSPDGRTLAIASYTKPVLLWNVADGAPRGSIALPSVFGLAYAPDRPALIMATEDKFIKVWDLDAGQERISLPFGECRSLALGPDGKAMVSTTPGGSVAYWSSASVAKPQRWKLPFGAPIRYHNTYVPAFAPDGRHFAVAGDNGKVYIFRVAPPVRR